MDPDIDPEPFDPNLLPPDLRSIWDLLSPEARRNAELIFRAIQSCLDRLRLLGGFVREPIGLRESIADHFHDCPGLRQPAVAILNHLLGLQGFDPDRLSSKDKVRYHEWAFPARVGFWYQWAREKLSTPEVALAGEDRFFEDWLGAVHESIYQVRRETGYGTDIPHYVEMWMCRKAIDQARLDHLVETLQS